MFAHVLPIIPAFELPCVDEPQSPNCTEMLGPKSQDASDFVHTMTIFDAQSGKLKSMFCPVITGTLFLHPDSVELEEQMLVMWSR